jgi:O-acetyl-ADP-ribose deacetylase (regulator of RNase III)
MKYEETPGDLIKMAQNGDFDVITHGCNCFSNMGAGIAIPMKRNFRCSDFPMERLETAGDVNKLGQIEGRPINIGPEKSVVVINSYTQYYPNAKMKPLDYEALTLCMRKINHRYKGKHIGLPKIGAGLAGGDWDKIKHIIQTELIDCDITVVIFEK